MCIIFKLQVKSLVTKSNAIELDSTKSISFKSMTEEVAHNTKMIFMPPILKYTWISIVINLSFHIGYVKFIINVKVDK